MRGTLARVYGDLEEINPADVETVDEPIADTERYGSNPPISCVRIALGSPATPEDTLICASPVVPYRRTARLAQGMALVVLVGLALELSATKTMAYVAATLVLVLLARRS